MSPSRNAVAVARISGSSPLYRPSAPDPPHTPALLRPRRQRPRRRRAAEEGDELASLHGIARHSITLSARTSRAVGKVRPSALAVFMLMCSSTFVGCWTGRSAGFSPLRMRPV